MGFLDRLGRVIRANLNSLVSQAEDPEKILEQTVAAGSGTGDRHPKADRTAMCSGRIYS